MREVPEAMVARIESGAALGFTDHDRPLTVDGVICAADGGMTAGAAERAAGEAASLTTVGVLDDDRLDEAGIVAGRFDGAAVEAWRVDWGQPDLRVRLWTARISRLIRADGGFTAELEGPAAALEQVVGRTYGRMCDADLGDARCRVDPGRVDLADRPEARCDKRWATCVGMFGNGVNFQGFPDIPGDDFLMVHPSRGGRHDGASRRQAGRLGGSRR